MTGESDEATSPATDVDVDVDIDAPPPPCLYPDHRLGTHGRLLKHQRVCLNCGDIVLVRRRGNQ